MKYAEIQELANTLQAKLVQTRRHLHQNPELSFQEVQTAAFVTQRLIDLGLEPISIATTGVYADIICEPGGQTLLLRADMDALPIQEETGAEYESKNMGVMHACGHDVHTTCLLGATEILLAHKDKLKCNVRLVFQPGEEVLPGGASILIKEGILDVPHALGIVGLHVTNELEVGHMGLRSGPYMASSDELHISIIGKGGHGAMPQHAIDPITIGAQMIVAAQQLVSRMGNPSIPSVLTFGMFQAGSATNIIPGRAEIKGTFRTFDEAWRSDAHAKLRKLLSGIVEGFGAEIELEIRAGYPALVNDPGLTSKVQQIAGELVGAEHLVKLDLRPTSEDFGWYTHHLPGTFIRLGTGNKARGIVESVHHPKFDIDEEALAIGAAFMASVAMHITDN